MMNLYIIFNNNDILEYSNIYEILKWEEENNNNNHYNDSIYTVSGSGGGQGVGGGSGGMHGSC